MNSQQQRSQGCPTSVPPTTKTTAAIRNAAAQSNSIANALINEAENEHFHLSESLISWMEFYKTTREDNPEGTLASILSSPISQLHQTSPSIIAWNLVNIFGRKQKCQSQLSTTLVSSVNNHQQQLEGDSNSTTSSEESKHQQPPVDDNRLHLVSSSESVASCNTENPRSHLHKNDKEILALVSEYTTVSTIQLDTIETTVINEDNVRQLTNDPKRTQAVISVLLSWLGDQSSYQHLNGFYYAANHLLKTILEFSPSTREIDMHNSILVDVCLAHPGSIQIFGPYLSPSSCSAQCFLDLYKIICSKQVGLGPMATFVLLSKFDIKSWLAANSTDSAEGYQELILATCSAFKDIGRNPDKSFESTKDLVKRHLQIELEWRKHLSHEETSSNGQSKAGCKPADRHDS